VEELDVTTVREATRHYGEATDDAPTGDPADAVGRLFALTLPAPQRDALVTAARDHDVAVADTGRKVVLGGSAAALTALADAVEEPSGLVDALTRVREGCR